MPDPAKRVAFLLVLFFGQQRKVHLLTSRFFIKPTQPLSFAPKLEYVTRQQTNCNKYFFDDLQL
jgi:hypothetical protein